MASDCLLCLDPAGPAGVCDNCERLLPKSADAASLCPSVARGPVVRRVPAKPAPLRRRRDRVRLQIPDRPPRPPIQVLRGPGDRRVPGRRTGSRGGRRTRPGSRPCVACLRCQASGARVQPGARSRPARGEAARRCRRCLGPRESPAYAAADGAGSRRPPAQSAGRVFSAAAVDGLRVAVVDDVVTTGTTLSVLAAVSGRPAHRGSRGGWSRARPSRFGRARRWSTSSSCIPRFRRTRAT